MSHFLCALMLAIAAIAACPGAAEARGGARGAHDCKAQVRATGSASILKRAARHNAVRAWEKDAESAAGRDYAKWEKAQKKLVSCKPAGRITVRCVARGAPCK